MNSILTDVFNLRTGTTDSEGRLILLVGHDELDDDDVPHTGVMLIEKDKVVYKEMLNWRSNSVCSVGHQSFIVLGEFGDYFYYQPGEKLKGNIFVESGAGRGGIMRSGTMIGNSCLWVGMSGLVFIRDQNIRWREVNASIPSDVDFEGAVEQPDQSAVAYGWKGALYRFANYNWTMVQSPTNLTLTCGCANGKGGVYIGGQNGLLLYGQEDMWDVVLEGSTVEDFWDLSYIENKLYIATMMFLYELKNNELVSIKYQDKIPKSCNRLTSSGSTLWSIGSKDLFRYADNVWNKIDIANPL